MLKKSYSKTKPVCKVTFSLPVEAAPQAENVRVLGQFNDWNWEEAVVLKKKKDNYEGSAELPVNASYEFRYLIDNHIWENDWKADGYEFVEPFGIYNSVVAVEAEPVKKAPAKKTAGKKAPVAKAAPKASAPKRTVKAQKDNLKKIEGIGPKIEKLLHADGIVTFNDLATAPEAKVQAVLDAAGPRFKMHKPATWAEQAKLAADGKWEALEKLQKELDGGKRKK